MSIADVNCKNNSENTSRKLTMITRDRQDTLTLETNINICEIYQDSLQKSHTIRSLVDFWPEKDTLKFSAHVYLMQNEKGEKILEATRWHYNSCPSCTLEEYRKTLEYKIQTYKYRIVNASVSRDSIGRISLVHQIY